MNLLLRLVWVRLLGRRLRGSCPVLGPCRTPFRVGPTDLDVLGHVNNGVYLSMLDVARVDLLVRSGLLDRLAGRGWYPVVAAETITFRRSLRLGQSFEVVTRVLGWDERSFFVSHEFERPGRAPGSTEVVASAVIRGRLLARTGGGVAPADVLALLDDVPEPPVVPEWVRRWSADTAAPARAAAA